MCLRFVFLLITRVAAWLRLSRRGKAWKTAEILVPPHQLALLQRRQPGRPKLNWADRALLATLLSVIPKARRQGLRLLITPDTIVRWHRDIVRRRWGHHQLAGARGGLRCDEMAPGGSLHPGRDRRRAGHHHPGSPHARAGRAASSGAACRPLRARVQPCPGPALIPARQP